MIDEALYLRSTRSAQQPIQERSVATELGSDDGAAEIQEVASAYFTKAFCFAVDVQGIVGRVLVIAPGTPGKNAVRRDLNHSGVARCGCCGESKWKQGIHGDRSSNLLRDVLVD